MAKGWIWVLVIMGVHLAFFAFTSPEVSWMYVKGGFSIIGCFIIGFGIVLSAVIVLATEFHWGLFMYKNVKSGLIIWTILNIYLIWLSFIVDFSAILFILLIGVFGYWTFIDSDPSEDKAHIKRINSIPKLKAWLDKTQDTESLPIKGVRRCLLLYRGITL